LNTWKGQNNHAKKEKRQSINIKQQWEIGDLALMPEAVGRARSGAEQLK
jgi:hypothetical protein